MIRRLHGQPVYDAIKTAAAKLLRAHGSAEAFASETGRCGETLRNHAGHGRPGFPATDWVVDAERDAPRPYVTAALAAANGYLVIPGPARFGASGAAPASLKEAGEFIAILAERVIADGETSEADARAVLPELDEAVAALAAYRAELTARFPRIDPVAGGRGEAAS